MITAKELAEKLNGRAYGDSFDDVKQEAKEIGLVIVYGASDDLMEFDGATAFVPSLEEPTILPEESNAVTFRSILTTLSELFVTYIT